MGLQVSQGETDSVLPYREVCSILPLRDPGMVRRKEVKRVAQGQRMKAGSFGSSRFAKEWHRND